MQVLSPLRHWVALTGTPGTGKSAAGRLFGSSVPRVELVDLARREGALRSHKGAFVVDMSRLRQRAHRWKARQSPQVVLGHLAHLLPVRDVIVLRCHPLELERRLRKRRAAPEAIRNNVTAEAIDLTLVESLQRRRRIWELDTTHRTPASVARSVRQIVRGKIPPRRAHVNWLGEPSVITQLLRRGS